MCLGSPLQIKNRWDMNSWPSVQRSNSTKCFWPKLCQIVLKKLANGYLRVIIIFFTQKRCCEMLTNFVSHVSFEVAALLDDSAAEGAERWPVGQRGCPHLDQPADLLLNDRREVHHLCKSGSNPLRWVAFILNWSEWSRQKFFRLGIKFIHSMTSKCPTFIFDAPQSMRVI